MDHKIINGFNKCLRCGYVSGSVLLWDLGGKNWHTCENCGSEAPHDQAREGIAFDAASLVQDIINGKRAPEDVLEMLPHSWGPAARERMKT